MQNAQNYGPAQYCVVIVIHKPLNNIINKLLFLISDNAIHLLCFDSDDH